VKCIINDKDEKNMHIHFKIKKYFIGKISNASYILIPHLMENYF